MIVEDVSETINEDIKEDDDNHMDVDERELLVVFIERLKQLDSEARDGDGDTFKKCKLVIKEILVFIENEYGFDEMVELIKIVSIDIGHPLAPIDKSIRKRLTRVGWFFDKITNDVRPLNDDELVALFK